MYSDSFKEYQILLFGTQSVGKSSIIRYYIAHLKPREQSLKLYQYYSLFKFAKGEAYLSFHESSDKDELSKRSLKDIDNIIFVIDITNNESFNKVKEWIQELKKDKTNFSEKSLAIFANKIDQLKDRTIIEEIKNYAKDNEIECFLTNANNGYQLLDGLSNIVNLAFEKRQKIINAKPEYEGSQEIGESGETVEREKKRKSNENEEDQKCNIFKKIFYCCFR